MTIGELKEAIKDLDNDTELLIYDPCYEISRVKIATEETREQSCDDFPGQKIFTLEIIFD